jgi:hypothetical protein
VPSSRAPSQPQWPTYGGRKNRCGSTATSSCWAPARPRFVQFNRG